MVRGGAVARPLAAREPERGDVDDDHRDESGDVRVGDDVVHVGDEHEHQRERPDEEDADEAEQHGDHQGDFDQGEAGLALLVGFQFHC